jgi:Cysteine rich repeat
MLNALTRAAKLGTLLAVAIFATAAGAQAPSQAQRDAIKSQCRSDYMAHCSSVPPGGAESLQCLQKNMSSLSAGCAGAVKAVEAPAAPKAEAAPKTDSTPAAARTEPAPAATTTAKPATETAAPKAAAAGTSAKRPSSAEISAIRSACRSDYPKVCAGVPTGGAAALQCLEKNKTKLSSACGQAVVAASGGAATAAGGATSTANANAAPAAAAPAASPLVLRPLRPREVIFVMRSACGADVRALCAGVDPGGGRIIECLATQSASLSPDCRGVLGQFAGR